MEQQMTQKEVDEVLIKLAKDGKEVKKTIKNNLTYYYVDGEVKYIQNIG